MVGTDERRAKLSEKDDVRGSGRASLGEPGRVTTGEALSEEFKSGEEVTTDIAGGRRKPDGRRWADDDAADGSGVSRKALAVAAVGCVGSTASCGASDSRSGTLSDVVFRGGKEGTPNVAEGAGDGGTRRVGFRVEGLELSLLLLVPSSTTRPLGTLSVSSAICLCDGSTTMLRLRRGPFLTICGNLNVNLPGRPARVRIDEVGMEYRDREKRESRKEQRRREETN